MGVVVMSSLCVGPPMPESTSELEEMTASSVAAVAELLVFPASSTVEETDRLSSPDVGVSVEGGIVLDAPESVKSCEGELDSTSVVPVKVKTV